MSGVDTAGEPPAHLLVVDDIPANVRLLEAILAPRGFRITSAASGPAALELIAAEDFDLVLLDVNMPGMGGYEVCRRVREDPRTALLPVVMVTAAPEEERVLALEAGADDFLRQPLEQAELLARVRSLTRLKRYHDAIERQAAELTALNHTLEDQVHGQLVELERLRILRRFLSPQLTEATFESGDMSLLEPHRREVTMLAWQLRGLTSVSAVAGPEEELAVLESFHELLGHLVGVHGATVGAFTGESMLGFFGDPVPDPDATRHAVALALALRDEGRSLGEACARKGYAVTTAIGIGLGYATLGRIGFEGRLDYGAVGPVVTRTWRLCGLAPEGGVLLDQASAEAVADLVETAPTSALDERDPSISAGAVVLRGLRGATSATAPEPAPARPAVPAEAAVARPATGLDLRVLGPLEVHLDGKAVAVTASKERALLAVLTANHGRTLRVDQLAEDLWEGSPPESAGAALRVHISRLRRTLAAGGVEGVIITRPPGYALDVPPEAVDITRFERRIVTAREAAGAGDHQAAVAAFREALALWRGPALAEVAGSPFVTAEAVRLEQTRLTALEECLTTELAAGRHREVTAELESLAHEHPFRERFWELLMLALYRAGRQQEALQAFQALRRQLFDELGLDPSPELVGLERSILAHDPTLRWDGAATSS